MQKTLKQTVASDMEPKLGAQAFGTSVVCHVNLLQSPDELQCARALVPADGTEDRPLPGSEGWRRSCRQPGPR